MRIFEEMESEVRGYIRSFPAVFDTAIGSEMYDNQGNRFVDFFAGAGSLNYGHNNPAIKTALIEYIQRDGVIHGLDKATVAKRDFLQKLNDTIFKPRNLEYKVQFTGPTGTNAVETALKLARMVKGRSNIIAFTNAYHGLSMGSLAVTGNSFYRDESYGVRANSAFIPFDGYLGSDFDSLAYLRKLLTDQSSGVDLPAAIIVETVQGEGGIHIARDEWMQGLSAICNEFDILLIIDDIQMGNGRTGTFFSFERAGITPDMVAVSKSIGTGLPMSLVLMRPELDQWKPGEHTGTFRGNNLAFVAATKALEYWDTPEFAEGIIHKGKIFEQGLQAIVDKYPELGCQLRGVGMVWGIEFEDDGFPSSISEEAFSRQLIIETAGAKGQVLKFLPALTIEEPIIKEGLAIIDESIATVLKARQNLRDGILS